MTEWDMHEACLGYIEVENRRTANKNHEGTDVMRRLRETRGEARASIVQTRGQDGTGGTISLGVEPGS